ncbi:MAG: transposase [Clostridia bacterium]|nr:transposase [Clostridia bacterium]
MELPKRKQNRLENFDYSSYGAYFITICTKNRRKILSSIVGDGAYDVPKTVLTEYGKIVEKYILSTEKIKNVFIEQYVIMPNHIHMIIFIENKIPKYENLRNNGTSRAPSPTNETIPHIVSTFKRFCNKDIGENIFQRSFYDHVIRNKQDYEQISKYIYENPTNWEMDELYQ